MPDDNALPRRLFAWTYHYNRNIIASLKQILIQPILTTNIMVICILITAWDSPRQQRAPQPHVHGIKTCNVCCCCVTQVQWTLQYLTTARLKLGFCVSYWYTTKEKRASTKNISNIILCNRGVTKMYWGRNFHIWTITLPMYNCIS